MKKIIYLLSAVCMFMVLPVQAQKTNRIINLGDIVSVADSKFEVPVTFNNVSKGDLRDAVVIADINGVMQEIRLTPDMLVSSADEVKVNIPVSAPSFTGLSNIRLFVKPLRGSHNIDSDVYSGNLMTLTRKADHKVVIEEFTGIWCPACPSGIVGIEKTDQVYGDKVLILVNHYNDVMSCRDVTPFIQKYVPAFPRALVDRDKNIDFVNPYLGTKRGDNGAAYGLGYDIDEQAAIAPVADIKVSVTLDGKKIKAKSETTFLYSGEADYGLAYVLTKDSMHNERWKQKNSLCVYYKGHDIVEKEPLFDRWLNGSEEVEGVMFDHVVVAAAEIEYGISGIIPQNVVEEEAISHEYTFDLEKYVKVHDTDNLTLGVLLIDRKTGKIINSAAAKVVTPLMIENVKNDDTEIKSSIYTAEGKRVTKPVRGLNIIKYNDGSVRKVLVK